MLIWNYNTTPKIESLSKSSNELVQLVVVTPFAYKTHQGNEPLID
jgi:hypothetical protein